MTFRMRLSAIIELLRPLQWAKNGFVLVPLFFGAGLLHSAEIRSALAAFVVFCLSASAVYIFNDWQDIEADRAHAKKKTRPLASGKIGVAPAVCLMAALLALSLALIWVAGLGYAFILSWASYLAINASYSLGLKRIPIVELFLVSSGFLIRLLAGGFAVHVVQSPWVITATLLISLLLATGKRRGDLARGNDVQLMRRSLAGYSIPYLDAVLSALTGATLVVYLLFCVSPYATQRYGEFVILTALPVSLGLMRYLQILIVYGDGDSPTELLFRDSALIGVVVAFVITFGLLIYVR